MADNSLYQRQQSIPLDIPKKVVVVGVGGVGSWVAYFLAMAGVPELWLFDHDTIEQHNLNRVPFLPEDVGKLKTQACAELIKRYRPECTVYGCGMFNPTVAGLIGDTVNWVVAATDSSKSREMIYNWGLRGGADRYLEVAAEGEIGSVYFSPSDFTTEVVPQVGYQSVPVWIGPAVSAAIMAVTYILHKHPANDVTIRAGWDAVRGEYHFYNSDYEYEEAQEITYEEEL